MLSVLCTHETLSIQAWHVGYQQDTYNMVGIPREQKKNETFISAHYREKKIVPSRVISHIDTINFQRQISFLKHTPAKIYKINSKSDSKLLLHFEINRRKEIKRKKKCCSYRQEYSYSSSSSSSSTINDENAINNKQTLTWHVVPAVYHWDIQTVSSHHHVHTDPFHWKRKSFS